MLRTVLIVAMVALSGCASNGGEPLSTATECNHPRPQVCTAIYNPVCGVAKDGTHETYASDCTACSNEGVTGFEKGECN